MLRGTSTTFDPASVRAVETNHAFADGEQTISASSGEVVLVGQAANRLSTQNDTGNRYRAPARRALFGDMHGLLKRRGDVLHVTCRREPTGTAPGVVLLRAMGCNH
jgi:hypothetical protein